MGSPREYFNTYASYVYKDTIKDRYRFACNCSITPNNVISIKLFPEHWDMINKQIDINECFPDRYWIWLRRHDLLEQAISRCIALQTSAWSSHFKPAGEPEYSTSEIVKSMKYIALSESRWRIFFSRNDITPLELWYEDIISSPEKIIMDIAKFAKIDIQPESLNSESQFEPQRTGLNNEWKQKFRSEVSDINYMDDITPEKNHSFTLENLWLLCTGKLSRF